MDASSTPVKGNAPPGKPTAEDADVQMKDTKKGEGNARHEKSTGKPAFEVVEDDSKPPFEDPPTSAARGAWQLMR